MVFSNWKTTIAGIGVAALNLFANGATPKQILISVALAIFGAVSKDFNVTGGTVPNKTNQ